MSELNGYLINPPVPLLLKEQDVVGDDDDDDDDVDEECVHKSLLTCCKSVSANKTKLIFLTAFQN